MWPGEGTARPAQESQESPAGLGVLMMFQGLGSMLGSLRCLHIPIMYDLVNSFTRRGDLSQMHSPV